MTVDLTPGGVAAGERVVAGGALYPRISAQQQQQQPAQQQVSASQQSDTQHYSLPHAANGTGGQPDAHQAPPQWAADGPKRKAEPFHGGTGYAAADGGAYQHGQKHQRIS